ncbi:DUF5677 domain-containing protein [Micromonospora parva]|uniref:DUF5677 domain-containing protein n=1 Tax=Micromonospora parva TaxID=1464048 RepID=UPI00340409A2
MNANNVEQRVKDLLESGDPLFMVESAVNEVRKLIDPRIELLTESVTQVEPPDRDLLNLCIARRQTEALSSIMKLCAEGQSYSATALLRPMCEDLIFGRWINTLSRSDADQFLMLKTLQEIFRGQAAQESFFPALREAYGRNRTEAAEKRIEFYNAQVKNLGKKLKDLGQLLGWKGRESPSVKRMAEQTDSLAIYEFFYHASSSSVHANPHHMYRMVWGTPGGNFSITNGHMESYYRHLAMIHGSYLYFEHWQLIQSHHPGPFEDVSEAINIWLALLIIPFAENENPGIITKRELAWRNPERGRPKE